MVGNDRIPIRLINQIDAVLAAAGDNIIADHIITGNIIENICIIKFSGDADAITPIVMDLIVVDLVITGLVDDKTIIFVVGDYIVINQIAINTAIQHQPMRCVVINVVAIDHIIGATARKHQTGVAVVIDFVIGNRHAVGIVVGIYAIEIVIMKFIVDDLQTDCLIAIHAKVEMMHLAIDNAPFGAGGGIVYPLRAQPPGDAAWLALAIADALIHLFITQIHNLGVFNIHPSTVERRQVGTGLHHIIDR